MLFVIQCRDKAGHEAVRADARPDHLEYLAKFEGRLKVAGPLLAEDGASPRGSLIIIDLESRAEAERFATNDPYARAGLFEAVSITPWRASVGVWLPKSA